MSTNYTTPRTWVAGEVVTAQNLNTHVRDNVKHLKEQVTEVDRRVKVQATAPSDPVANDLWVDIS
jgi:hypothetical protein